MAVSPRFNFRGWRVLLLVLLISVLAGATAVLKADEGIAGEAAVQAKEAVEANVVEVAADVRQDSLDDTGDVLSPADVRKKPCLQPWTYRRQRRLGVLPDLRPHHASSPPKQSEYRSSVPYTPPHHPRPPPPQHHEIMTPPLIGHLPLHPGLLEQPKYSHGRKGHSGVQLSSSHSRHSSSSSDLPRVTKVLPSMSPKSSRRHHDAHRRAPQGKSRNAPPSVHAGGQRPRQYGVGGKQHKVEANKSFGSSVNSHRYKVENRDHRVAVATPPKRPHQMVPSTHGRSQDVIRKEGDMGWKKLGKGKKKHGIYANDHSLIPYPVRKLESHHRSSPSYHRPSSAHHSRAGHYIRHHRPSYNQRDHNRHHRDHNRHHRDHNRHHSDYNHHGKHHHHGNPHHRGDHYRDHSPHRHHPHHRRLHHRGTSKSGGPSCLCAGGKELSPRSLEVIGEGRRLHCCGGSVETTNKSVGRSVKSKEHRMKRREHRGHPEMRSPPKSHGKIQDHSLLPSPVRKLESHRSARSSPSHHRPSYHRPSYHRPSSSYHSRGSHNDRHNGSHRGPSYHHRDYKKHRDYNHHRGYPHHRDSDYRRDDHRHRDYSPQRHRPHHRRLHHRGTSKSVGPSCLCAGGKVLSPRRLGVKDEGRRLHCCGGSVQANKSSGRSVNSKEHRMKSREHRGHLAVRSRPKSAHHHQLSPSRHGKKQGHSLLASPVRKLESHRSARSSPSHHRPSYHRPSSSYHSRGSDNVRHNGSHRGPSYKHREYKNYRGYPRDSHYRRDDFRHRDYSPQRHNPHHRRLHHRGTSKSVGPSCLCAVRKVLSPRRLGVKGEGRRLHCCGGSVEANKSSGRSVNSKEHKIKSRTHRGRLAVRSPPKSHGKIQEHSLLPSPVRKLGSHRSARPAPSHHRASSSYHSRGSHNDRHNGSHRGPSYHHRGYPHHRGNNHHRGNPHHRGYPHHRDSHYRRDDHRHRDYSPQRHHPHHRGLHHRGTSKSVGPSCLCAGGKELSPARRLGRRHSKSVGRSCLCAGGKGLSPPRGLGRRHPLRNANIILGRLGGKVETRRLHFGGGMHGRQHGREHRQNGPGAVVPHGKKLVEHRSNGRKLAVGDGMDLKLLKKSRGGFSMPRSDSRTGDSWGADFVDAAGRIGEDVGPSTSDFDGTRSKLRSGPPQTLDLKLHQKKRKQLKTGNSRDEEKRVRANFRESRNEDAGLLLAGGPSGSSMKKEGAGGGLVVPEGPKVLMEGLVDTLGMLGEKRGGGGGVGGLAIGGGGSGGSLKKLLSPDNPLALDTGNLLSRKDETQEHEKEFPDRQPAVSHTLTTYRTDRTETGSPYDSSFGMETPAPAHPSEPEYAVVADTTGWTSGRAPAPPPYYGSTEVDGAVPIMPAALGMEMPVRGDGLLLTSSRRVLVEAPSGVMAFMNRPTSGGEPAAVEYFHDSPMIPNYAAAQQVPIVAANSRSSHIGANSNRGGIRKSRVSGRANNGGGRGVRGKMRGNTVPLVRKKEGRIFSGGGVKTQGIVGGGLKRRSE